MGHVTVQDPDDDHAEDDRTDAHLNGVEPGAGCTEIWEHLSEHRETDEE